MSTKPNNTKDGEGNHVARLTASIIIDAPREAVWKVLTDYPSYEEWNPFIRSQAVISRNDTSEVLADQTPADSQYLLMSVRMPPTMDDSKLGFMQKQSVVVDVIKVDREGYRLAWRRVGESYLQNKLLQAERWQTLEEEDGGRKTRYTSSETFDGPGAYFIKYVVRKSLMEGFEAMAATLKRKVEVIVHDAQAST